MTSISRKIMGCFVAVAAIALLIPLFYFRFELRRDLQEDAAETALLQAKTLSYMLESAPDKNSILQNISGMLGEHNGRVTVLDASGEVIFDSSLQGESPEQMDNHLNRPEIQEAISFGSGSFIRRSNTTQSELLYVALKLEDGGFLRLAVPYASLDGLIYSRLYGVIVACAVALALSLLLAWLFSWRLRRDINDMVEVVESISKGNYGRRLHHVPVKEFADLASGVNIMSENIERQVQRVADRNSQLESILQTVPDGVLVLDAHGNIRSYNPALEQLFPEFAGSVGRFLPEVLAVYNISELLHELLQGKGRSDSGVRTIELERPLGRFLLVRLARPASEQLQGSRYSLGAVLVFTDITRIARLERTRRDFVANVSHELRTPLTAVQGYAETLSSLIASGESLESQQRFAGIIESQAARLARLVEDLLTLSRFESAAQCPQGAACNASSVLTDVLQLFSQAADNRKVKIELAVDESLDLALSPDHLFQVLENLLDNAMRLSPANGRICVTVQRSGEYGCISVADQGPGISLDDQERIFERFYKAGDASGQSTGLGLAICKHIVEFYGGNISVKSPAGDFSTLFSVTLKAL